MIRQTISFVVASAFLVLGAVMIHAQLTGPGARFLLIMGLMLVSGGSVWLFSDFIRPAFARLFATEHRAPSAADD